MRARVVVARPALMGPVPGRRVESGFPVAVLSPVHDRAVWGRSPPIAGGEKIVSVDRDNGAAHGGDLDAIDEDSSARARIDTEEEGDEFPDLGRHCGDEFRFRFRCDLRDLSPLHKDGGFRLGRLNVYLRPP